MFDLIEYRLKTPIQTPIEKRGIMTRWIEEINENPSKGLDIFSFYLLWLKDFIPAGPPQSIVFSMCLFGL